MKNKFAVVTGASRGIGRAIAIQLAQEGAFVVLVGRTKHQLEETKKLILANQGEAEIMLADLSKVESTQNLLETIKHKTAHVDILVNVAGIWHGENELYANKDFESFTQQVVLDTYAVGLIAPTLLTHALIPLMPKGSKILNISGTFENGAKGWLPYYVSKKAIEDLTVGLSEELAEKDIQVNAISPSDTATESYAQYFPQFIPDAIEPTEIAKYATYLCSAQANKVTGKVFVMKKNQAPFEGYHS